MKVFAVTVTLLLSFGLGVQVRGDDVDTVIGKLKEKVAGGQVGFQDIFQPLLTSIIN